ncbi:hypothetical protein GCM10007161_20150 [Ignatzschineria indica]|nr:hypothetical protein GCM10007161_20150 [Ignatzschineria indica]
MLMSSNAYEVTASFISNFYFILHKFRDKPLATARYKPNIYLSLQKENREPE